MRISTMSEIRTGDVLNQGTKPGRVFNYGSFGKGWHVWYRSGYDQGYYGTPDEQMSTQIKTIHRDGVEVYRK